jgi:hypothetical protein
MTRPHSNEDPVPELTQEELWAEQMRMRRLRRKRAQEELSLMRMAPHAVIVLDRGTGDHFTMPASPALATD